MAKGVDRTSLRRLVESASHRRIQMMERDGKREQERLGAVVNDKSEGEKHAVRVALKAAAKKLGASCLKPDIRISDNAEWRRSDDAFYIEPSKELRALEKAKDAAAVEMEMAIASELAARDRVLAAIASVTTPEVIQELVDAYLKG